MLTRETMTVSIPGKMTDSLWREIEKALGIPIGGFKTWSEMSVFHSGNTKALHRMLLRKRIPHTVETETQYL